MVLGTSSCVAGDQVASCGGDAGTCSACTDVETCTNKACATAVPVSVACGGAHSCAVMSNQTAYCWGENLEGELGAGDSLDRAAPVRVDAGPNIVEMALGAHHSCARFADGTVSCWGRNDVHQVGTPDASSAAVLTPQPVSDVSGAVALTSGADFTCALDSDGGATCWGSSSDYQLGLENSSMTPSPPMPVPSSPYGHIVAGYRHTFASSPLGLYGWGSNADSEVVNSSQGYPLNVPKLVTTQTEQGLALGAVHTCAIFDGGVQCWGGNPFGQLGNAGPGVYPTNAVKLVGNAKSICAGAHYTCALLTDGGVTCWGANDTWQLGSPDAGTLALTSRVAIPASPVTDLECGDSHACAIAGAKVYCWGQNDGGQVSRPSSSPLLTPTHVPLP